MHAARESRSGRYVGMVASVLLLAGLLVVWARPAASQGIVPWVQSGSAASHFTAPTGTISMEPACGHRTAASTCAWSTPSGCISGPISEQLLLFKADVGTEMEPDTDDSTGDDSGSR